MRRSQGGNNNAYCQNPEISWFDWAPVERYADVLRFAEKFIALRMSRELPVERSICRSTNFCADNRSSGTE